MLVISSTRKAAQQLKPGVRVEVWSANKKVDAIYARTAYKLNYFIDMEWEHIRAKQEAAERRNQLRRQKGGKNHER